ncbi:MAG: tetratricopeptide repeat protein, partial [Bacteroidota bacterium]
MDDLARVYNSIGAYYRLEKKFEAARKVFAEAISIRKKLLPEKRISLLPTLLNYSDLLFEMDSVSLAYSTLQEALEIHELEYSDTFAGEIYKRLGNVKLKQHKADEALNFYQKTLQLKIGKTDYWKSLQDIANCYQALNELNLAASYYQHAQEAFHGSIVSEEYLILQNDRALNYLYQDNLEAAEYIYNRVIPVAKQHSKKLLAIFYQNASNYLLQKAYAESDNELYALIESYIQEAIQIYQEDISSTSYLANCWNRLGDCFLMQSKYTEAEKYYHKAYEIKPTEIAKFNFKLGMLHYSKAEYSGAIHYFDKAKQFAYTDSVSIALKKAKSIHAALITGQSFTWQDVFCEYELARNQMLCTQSRFSDVDAAIYLRDTHYPIYDGLVESSFASND